MDGQVLSLSPREQVEEQVSNHPTPPPPTLPAKGKHLGESSSSQDLGGCLKQERESEEFVGAGEELGSGVCGCVTLG